MALKIVRTPFPLQGGRVGDGGARADPSGKGEEATPPPAPSVSTWRAHPHSRPLPPRGGEEAFAASGRIKRAWWRRTDVWGLAAAVATTLLLAQADAQTQPAPPVQPTPKAAAPVLAPMTPLPPRAPDPDLDFNPPDTTQRVGGLADLPLGGADCRTTCDKTYYICLSTEDADQCSSAWTRCLVACPQSSSSF
jgi:hypothetical protein